MDESPHILLVDDEESLRFTLNLYLSKVGYNVTLAANVSEAEACIEKTNFQVAIIDRMLPEGRSGIELLEMFRKQQPLCQTVLISAYPSFESAAEAMRHKPFAYLAKPVKKMDILSTVASALKYGGQKKAAIYRERLFDSLFNHSPNAVAVYDLDFKVKYINPEFTCMFGYGKAEALGQSFEQICELDEIGEKLNSDIIKRDAACITKDGRKIDVSYTATLCMDDQGRPFEILVNFWDVSKTKSLERKLAQAQKMETMGALAGNIAHDFNNILCPIIGYTEMSMDDQSEPDEIKGNLKNVLQAAKRAQKLVNQILTFSRKSKECVKAVEIGAIVREALDLMRASLPSSIEIHKQIDNQCGRVCADPTHIHQIIMNLCTNAYHAMKDRKGRLTVALKRIEINQMQSFGDMTLREGAYVQIAVSDNGQGIAPENRKSIFEPYFTTKPRGQGTGLGLSVIRGITQSYGGAITVDSTPGEGSTFNVYLPQKLEGPLEDALDGEGFISGGTERILVAEDELMTSRMLNQMLSYMGYQVEAFGNGVKALAAFEKKPFDYDLILTDIDMPQMDGFELARAAKAIRSDIRIVVITGSGADVYAKQIEDAPIDGFLNKPVLRQKLSAMIRMILDKNETANPRGSLACAGELLETESSRMVQTEGNTGYGAYH